MEIPSHSPVRFRERRADLRRNKAAQRHKKEALPAYIAHRNIAKDFFRPVSGLVSGFKNRVNRLPALMRSGKMIYRNSLTVAGAASELQAKARALTSRLIPKVNT